MSLSVIIPSKNTQNLIPCMEAVRRGEPDARIVVIDDGLDLSWLPRPDLMPAYGIAGVKPFVYARNVNLGIQYAASDDVVLLNDDALLQSHGGFTLLQQCVRASPEFGIIAAATNVSGNPNQQYQGIGLREDEMVCFVAVYLPRTTIDRVGLLDERFVHYGWEDNDYCRRVLQAGLRVGIHDHCQVDHGSLVSTFRGSARGQTDLSANRAIFEQKWGVE